ncbi:biopolymer transporter ExbD [Psychromarinibacter sp. C21-152]|uniref:Biopolymer transporter ExbD n=1 Tax=Psychromarinibacter sediminicola TaxID=3033385 RepID=A0AAE3NYL1_9RHOB|nr:biopolymer transporter ExbD [Psychromarinibacter sediminicola]MDF0603285.1 biopolymer transporter ExbD [Psychromarinibacter sediminicola]
MPVRTAAPRRRAVSMTSLIDVIFLLPLFFMLTSTFTKFAEIPLSTGGAGAGGPAPEAAPLFLRLSQTELSLNGETVALEALPDRLDAQAGDGAESPVLVSPTQETTSQRLVDLLVALRGLPGVDLRVLE